MLFCSFLSSTKYELDPPCSEAALNPFDVSCPSHQDPASSSLLISTVVPSEPQRSIAVSHLEPDHQDVLLPPAAFMVPRTQRAVSTLMHPPSAFTGEFCFTFWLDFFFNAKTYLLNLY